MAFLFGGIARISRNLTHWRSGEQGRPHTRRIMRGWLGGLPVTGTLALVIPALAVHAGSSILFRPLLPMLGYCRTDGALKYYRRGILAEWDSETAGREAADGPLSFRY